MLYRYDYYQNHISNVILETAGTVDLDVELKFKLGSEIYSIDIQKKQLEDVKDLYKALIKISEITKENASYLQFSEQSLHIASTTLSRITSEEIDVFSQFKEINNFAYTWLKEKKQTYIIKDFGYIFEKYINN